MFTTRTLLQRAVVVTVSVATATGLAWAGSSTASAHPGVFDSETCAESLTRVWTWPGPISDVPRDHFVFSDAYESYVLRQPPCNGQTTASTTTSYDEDQVGHQFPR